MKRTLALLIAAIAAGGMEKVYRARDRRLGRYVAIKILLSHLSSKPQFRERFERETKTDLAPQSFRTSDRRIRA